MPTAAQRALSAGIRTLTRNVGDLFVFAGHSFRATVSEPAQVTMGYPRGTTVGPEYDLELEVEIDGLETMPREGQTITRDGINYKIVAVRNPPGTHKVVFHVYQPK